MIDYPKLKELPSSREMLNTFKGYNQNLRIKESEFRDMENLSGDCYPVLSVRKPRTTVCAGRDINALDCSFDRGLFYTDGGCLHAPLKDMPGFYQEGERHQQQFVPMGEHLILVPEMMWLDTR